MPPDKANEISDDRILELLREFDLDVGQAGGLDRERDWDAVLSLREQQLLALVGIILAGPRFVFLDRLDTTLEPDEFRNALHALSRNAITYLNSAATSAVADLYEAKLTFEQDGKWTWTMFPSKHQLTASV